MKKINLIMACAAVVLCLAACSKKGDCTCTTTTNGVAAQAITTSDVEEDACKALNATQTMQGMSIETKCTFKG